MAVDVRVQRTRRALESAIAAIGADRDLLDISVEEVCATSGVSRATFYRYARSPAAFWRDRLEAVMERWVDEFLATCASDDPVERLRSHGRALTSVWQELEAHFDFYARNLTHTDTVLLPLMIETQARVHFEYVRRNLHGIEVPLVMQRADPEWVTATLANHYAHSVTA